MELKTASLWSVIRHTQISLVQAKSVLVFIGEHVYSLPGLVGGKKKFITVYDCGNDGGDDSRGL